MASAVLGKVSPTPKGEYVSTQDYDRLDVVTYEGYPYLAKSNVPSGNLPTDELYWMPLLTGLDFAPGGYGLGTTGAYCADANNANKSGWYGVDTNTTNIPSGAAGTMFAKTLSTENGTDIYQTVTSGVTAIRRYYSSWAGAWQPWEYENPPMSLGVEYRTTERWNGMPVYTKLVDCGAMPNNSTKEVTVFTGSECKILRVSGYTGYTNSTTSFEKFTLPYKVSSSYEMGCHAKSNGTNANIVLYSSYDTSGFGQTYVTVWYVKT